MKKEEIMILKKVILTIILYQSFVFASLLDNWLKTHKAEEFKGKVWIRARIDEPEDLKYIIKVWCNLNPPGLSHKDLGFITKKGLQNTEPKEEESWFKAGEESLWVELPTPVASTGYVKLSVKILEQKEKNIKIPEFIELYIQIATGPDTKDIFYETEILTDSNKSGVNILLPTKGGLDGLKEVKTFDELFSENIKIIEEKFGKNYPVLEKIRMSMWVHIDFGGKLPNNRAENLYKLFKAIGINGIGDPGHIPKETRKEFDLKYNIVKNGGIYWPYGLDLKKIKESEDIEEYIETYADNYYKNKEKDETIIHANVGDEIHPIIGASHINGNPAILGHFHEYLEKQRLNPRFFGVNNWDEVKATQKRELANSEKIEDRRIFYWSYRYINYLTSIFYSKITSAIHKYFPNIKTVSPNFQAGPCQMAFLGNDNHMREKEYTAFLDLFEFGRKKVFTGIQIEDWVYGWHCGLGRIDLGGAIMRACARKHSLYTFPLVVGGESIIGKSFVNLMNGCKGVELYLYGPIGQIGPAWAKSEKAVLEAAELARMLDKFEDEIYNSNIPPSQVALLIASTSDIMQAKDLYFLTERQHVYMALRHNYIPVDIISEQDIIEDNILKDYKVLYLTDSNLQKKTQEKIVEWVKEGGFLWAEVGAGMFDEYNSRSYILEQVFGLKNYQIETQPDWLKWSAAFYSTPSTKFKYEELTKIKLKEEFIKDIKPISVWGMRMKVEPQTAKVIGSYEDNGSPAILINDFGKGKAILVGALMGDAYVRSLYGIDKLHQEWKYELAESERNLICSLVEMAGIKKRVSLSVPCLYANVSTGKNYKILWILNHPPRKMEELNEYVKEFKIKVLEESKVSKVISYRFGELNFEKENEYVTFKIPFTNADIILIKSIE
jgi:hypothetical protein